MHYVMNTHTPLFIKQTNVNNYKPLSLSLVVLQGLASYFSFSHQHHSLYMDPGDRSSTEQGQNPHGINTLNKLHLMGTQL